MDNRQEIKRARLLDMKEISRLRPLLLLFQYKESSCLYLNNEEKKEMAKDRQEEWFMLIMPEIMLLA